MTVEPTPALSREDAQRLTQRIQLIAGNAREAMEKLSLLVEQARSGRAHAALGFASWTDYLSSTLGASPMRLDRDQRRELVAYLAGEGMSTRAIAPIVGAGHVTVHRDLEASRTATVPNETVDRPSMVTSLDGRQRPSAQPDRAATAVESYPELQHYRDKGDDRHAVRIAEALDGMPDSERNVRREALAGAIAADKRGTLTPTPDPTDAILAAADRVFLAANAATRELRMHGDRLADAVPHADRLLVSTWHDEFADLANLCNQLAAACVPQGLRVVK